MASECSQRVRCDLLVQIGEVGYGNYCSVKYARVAGSIRMIAYRPQAQTQELVPAQFLSIK